jgi:hypothetical protein
MSDEQPTIHEPAVQEPLAPAHEPIDEEQDEWLDEADGPDDACSPRFRSRCSACC